MMQSLKMWLADTKMAEQSCLLQYRGQGRQMKNACFGTYAMPIYGKMAWGAWYSYKWYSLHYEKLS